jgi:ketosteroid isomerase-like protein
MPDPQESVRDESIRAFLESYRAAWERRDLDALLAMYDRPLLTLRLDGSLHCLQAQAEFRPFFSAALEGYIATGYQTAELSVDRIAPAGRTAALVDVTWTLRSPAGTVVRTFRQTYNLRANGSGWRIYASTQHVE